MTATDPVGASASDTFALTVTNVNDAPLVTSPMLDQSVRAGTAFSYQLPADTFTDVDADDSLTYAATLANGDPLPTWLAFDPATRTFSGTPTEEGSGIIDVQVAATDQGGLSVADTFNLSILPAPQQGITIIGTSANDVLNGTAGNDTLDGRGGSDLLLGGGGSDTLLFSADSVASPFELAFNEGSPGATGLFGLKFIGGKGRSLDRYDGGTGSDLLVGTAGDDAIFLDDGSANGPKIIDVERIDAGNGNDVVDLTSWRYGYSDVVLDGGAGADALWSSSGNDLLLGGAGNDELDGGVGNNVLQGASGNDRLVGGQGRNLLDGGAGADIIVGGSGSELIIGGTGNDIFASVAGADVIAFNRGDGRDSVLAIGGRNTVSLGGGIANADLSFKKSGYDLILETGNGDAITFKAWYLAPTARTVLTLQMIEEAAADFDASGSDPLRDHKVEQFDFAGLVTIFDQARAANPYLTSWSLTNALGQFHLGGSDSEALGGALAYQYGKDGAIAGVGLTAAQEVLSHQQFGTSPQALQPLAGLQEGAVKLG